MFQSPLGKNTKLESRTFVDVDLNFKIYDNKDVKLKNGENAIKQSIKNLLSFNRYDKPFNPNIDVGLNYLLFEPMSSDVATTLEIAIGDILNTYEPRIGSVSVNVVGDEENNLYDISITFSIINTEMETTVEFFLERLR
tara:strand:+ start:15489 stop:15905 length:417 start_codon:yes stop_codon:yes gene_type:complete